MVTICASADPHPLGHLQLCLLHTDSMYTQAYGCKRLVKYCNRSGSNTLVLTCSLLNINVDHLTHLILRPFTGKMYTHTGHDGWFVLEAECRQVEAANKYKIQSIHRAKRNFQSYSRKGGAKIVVPTEPFFLQQTL